MKKFQNLGLIIALCLFLVSTNGFSSGKSGNSRANKKLGLYASLSSDPFPSLWGVNAGFNIASFLRFTAAYGSITLLTTSVSAFNVGAKAFVPGWNFSPVVGWNYNFISSNATSFIFGNQSVTNVTGSNLNTMTLNFGLDWQMDGGFLLGGTYTMPIGNALWNGASSVGFYIGFFFV